MYFGQDERHHCRHSDGVYVTSQVLWQWLSLVGNETMITLVTSLEGGLYDGDSWSDHPEYFSDELLFGVAAVMTVVRRHMHIWSTTHCHVWYIRQSTLVCVVCCQRIAALCRLTSRAVSDWMRVLLLLFIIYLLFLLLSILIRIWVILLFTNNKNIPK